MSGLRLIARTFAVVALVTPAGIARAQATPPAGLATETSVSEGQTRLFLGASGRALPKGEGYFGLGGLVVPFFQVGVTDRFSVGAGAPFAFLAGPIALFTPKYQIVRGTRTSAAVGLIHLAAWSGHMDLAYVAATRGTGNQSVTISAGMATAGDGEQRGHTIVIGLATEHRVRAKTTIMTDTRAFRGGALVSAGIRQTRGRCSADFMLFAPIVGGHVFVGPMINLAWRFPLRTSPARQQ